MSMMKFGIDYRINILFSGLVVVGMFFCACRKSHRRPTEAVSADQEKLTSVMETPAEKPVSPVLLSLELRNLAKEYFSGNSAQSVAAVDSFSLQLDSAALFLSSKLFMEPDPHRSIDAITEYIFTKWAVTFDSNRDNPATLFPHAVLQGKKGSCVGMSLLYLLFAEKMGLPVYGVLAPEHLFVRYDNGKVRFNIETLRKGESMSDGWYRQRWAIRDTGLYPLNNLSPAGVLAVVHYNIGNIFMLREETGKAREHFMKALEFLPGFPEALGNLALVYEADGNPQQALEILAAIKKKHPAFRNIDGNLAALQLKCGKYIAALSLYSQLSQCNPENPDFLYGRGVALFNLNRGEEAADALQRAIELKPAYPEARQLLERIGK